MNVSQPHASTNSNSSYSALPAPSPSRGLMESHMNVLKLVEIKSGLTWQIYSGKALEDTLPGESKVLLSFSRCLSAGLACCYQACQFNPVDGPGQNATRLVVFSFKQEHIDLPSKIDPSLTSQGTWNADDGLTEEVKKYLDLALQNLIERMLHADGYVTLGTWFCRHDLTSDRQFLYRLNYFNQESSCVCAAVCVMQLSVGLRALSCCELTEGNLKGRKVVLSPCGISGQLTGRSFSEETQGSLDILSEWKLVYPNMFLSPASPPLLEVLLAGVCMKYPTQFLLTYTHECTDTHSDTTREISPPTVSVRDLIDGVYTMDMQNGGCEYLPWNRVNLDFGKSSTSSPGGDRLSLRADTPSFLTQDRKPSIIHAPSPFVSRMASSEVMDLTHLSTPIQTAPADGVFLDRKKSNAASHHPPQTLKISKEEPQQDDSVWRVVTETNSARPNKRTKSSTTFWFRYTLPDSIQALETLYDTGESLLDYDCSGIQHPAGALGYSRGIGAVGRAQAAKTKKGRTRTRSEKSSTSKTPTSRKKRPSKSEAKKQQTPTGREDKPPDLPLVPDRDMPPPTSGSHSNGSVSNLPELPLYNDITEMRRTPVLDVLVPTPTALNAQFNMPEPTPVFTPGPYAYGCNSSPSTDCTPQQSQSQTHRQPVFPGPPSAHGPSKHQMPEQIFETDDEDSITIDPSQPHPMDPAMRLEAELGKKNSHLYSKNSNPLLLDETLSILTPPSNRRSPTNTSCQTIQTLDCFVNISILELVPESFGPCHSVNTFLYTGMKQYQASCQSSPVTNKRRLSLCRDLGQLTDHNILSNADDIRSRSSSRGVTEATGAAENQNLLPGTPSGSLSALTQSVSEPISIKRETSDSARRALSHEEASNTPDTQTRTRHPETHALLLNLMLLDPRPISPYTAQMTPFQPLISSHSTQPSHFTFPPNTFVPQDELLTLDTLLTYGAARDLSLHTLEFYEDRLLNYFPLGYLNSAYAAVAPSGWHRIGACTKPSHSHLMHCIQPEPLPGDTGTPPSQEHSHTLSLTLELIQRHCLSAGGPLLPPKPPPDSSALTGGVSDLYDRRHLASTLRECCRLYASSVGEEDTLMELTEETSSGPREPSSPATNETNEMSASALEASQSETETSERPESETSQEEDEEGPVLQLDFSLDVDNDGSWLNNLQQSSDKKTAKLLRKLQSSLPKLMLHGRTHSPLSWTELFRILAPGQGNDSHSSYPAPLPIPSLLAGQDTDWVEVAPYDVTSWDKLSLSPYSTREDISYLVVSPGGDRNENRVSNYFKQLSLVYQDSDLGRHRCIPYTNCRSEGVYTFTPPSSPLYLEPDSLSAIKHLLTTVILPQLSSISWPLDKQRKDTDAPSSSSSSSLPSNAYRLHSTGPSSGGEGHPSVVLYLLNTGAPHQQVDIMRVFSEALLDNCLSEDLSRRLTLCVVPAQEVISQRRISTQSLRALCFDVFSKCRYFPNSWVPSRGMSFVEDCDDWRGILYQNKSHQASLPPVTSPWIYRPPYILAKPLSLRLPSVAPNKRTELAEFNLGQKSSSTLFCGYCVSPGNSYLLAVCCDSQGSLLDSAVIGLRYPGKPDAFLSREQSLRDLWRYILSILKQTVLTWNVVITRLGRPSNEELRDLKRIVRLDSVQSDLTKACVSCSCRCNTHIPSVQSVHLLSFQPEKNFRVFLNDTNTPLHSLGHSSTHVLVQPGPNCLDTYTQTDDFDMSENVCFFGEMGAPGQPQPTEELGEDISIFDMVGAFGGLPTPGGAADSVDNYHAVGYVLSSANAGPLPAAFWGRTRERNAFFRVQLHGQFYLDLAAESRLSYEESLKRILEQCDALSWLVLNPETGGRVSALPLHLYTLCNLHQLVTWLNTKQN